MGRALWMDAAGIPAKVKKRKPVNKVSKRQAERLKQYKIVRDKLLKDHPVCQRCYVHPSTECHHMIDRVGKNLFSPLLALCSQCHRWVTDHPKKAMETGYIFSRAVGNIIRKCIE